MKPFQLFFGPWRGLWEPRASRHHERTTGWRPDLALRLGFGESFQIGSDRLGGRMMGAECAFSDLQRLGVKRLRLPIPALRAIPQRQVVEARGHSRRLRTEARASRPKSSVCPSLGLNEETLHLMELLKHPLLVFVGGGDDGLVGHAPFPFLA